MTATEFYRAGKLQEAVQAQLQEVKKAPADNGKRLFLFELLCFAGDLERAAKQIEAVHYDDAPMEMATQSYRVLAAAEQFRRRVFSEGVMPQFLIKPPEWLGARLQAVPALRAGKSADAAKLIAESDQAATPVKGTLNGKPFDSLRDCDDLFGPVLEVMAHGEYYWVPLEQVEAVTANPPKFPRDLYWLPAKLHMRDGPAGDVFLPVLYPDSHQSTDEGLKLGRATDWKEAEGGPVRGVGLRLFLAGEDAVPVLDFRDLQLNG